MHLSFSLNISKVLLKEKKTEYLKLMSEEISPKNELHELVLRIQKRKKRFDLFYSLPQEQRERHSWVVQYTEPPISLNRKELVSHNQVENVGIAAMFKHLDALNVDYLYVSDYNFYPQGFDLIARDLNGIILICESKGTTSRIKTPSEYLSRISQKGRQLSWEWCWNSLIELTPTPFGCNLFLEVYQQFIRRDKIERLLLVTRCSNCNNSFVIDETRVFQESQIDQVPEAEFRFKKWQKQLLQLEKAGLITH